MLALFLFGLYLIVVSVLFHRDRMSWWIKIDTCNPTCTYYFGPFDSHQEATHHQGGYLEDLHREGAKNIQVTVERACPKILTAFEGESPLSPTETHALSR